MSSRSYVVTAKSTTLLCACDFNYCDECPSVQKFGFEILMMVTTRNQIGTTISYVEWIGGSSHKGSGDGDTSARTWMEATFSTIPGLLRLLLR